MDAVIETSAISKQTGGERLNARAQIDINTNANSGCATSPHAPEVGHNIRAPQLQESNREDFVFTLVRILATPFKRSSLCAAGGLLSSQ